MIYDVSWVDNAIIQHITIKATGAEAQPLFVCIANLESPMFCMIFYDVLYDPSCRYAPMSFCDSMHYTS